MQIQFDEPVDGPVYVCPLCWAIFDESALNPPPSLTLEDVPPKGVGGRPLVLTCATCNNTAGTKVDADAVEHQRALQAIRGEGGSVPIRLDGGVNANLEIDADGSRRIFVDPDRSNPTVLAALFERLDLVATDSGEGASPADAFLFEATVTRKHDPDDVKVSLLRAAYLVVFAVYGYRLVLTPAFRPLRRLLRDLDLGAIPVAPVLASPGAEQGLWGATHPDLGSVLLVVFGDSTVALPDPLHVDETWWDLLPTAGRPDEPFEMVASVPWPSEPQHQLDFLQAAPPAEAGEIVDLFGDP